jgi:hypothetical protein
MGDQKDHMTIQKKDTETVSNTFDSHDYETATESVAPPALQFKSEEQGKEEGVEKNISTQENSQFSLDGPPEEDKDNASKIFSGDTLQGKGIAEPFKIPVVQKKLNQPEKGNQTDRPSFSL